MPAPARRSEPPEHLALYNWPVKAKQLHSQMVNSNQMVAYFKMPLDRIMVEGSSSLSMVTSRNT